MLRKLIPPGPLGLSNDVRRVLRQARMEAVRLRHAHVGAEHLLLGLLRTSPPGMLGFLERMGVEPRDLTAEVEAAMQPGSDGAPLDPRRLPHTHHAKHVFELAMAEAHATRNATVNPRHLLFALLAEEQGIAGEVCRRLGITLERARAAMSAPATHGDPRVLVRLDDASERSIYEQIVAQVQEQVATGALPPGERLPPVRRLADQLDVAPGTVARAYSELERLGVVVTEGARGTRVANRKEASPDAEIPSETLVGLLRPVAVAAFHLGATADQLRAALDEAMRDIFAGGPKTAG